MTLVLEIEYLAGICFAAVGPDSAEPDWPPQPDRVFSALVATWAAHGQDHEETKALQWLESLPTPQLLERGAEPRTSAMVFVPPNDPRSDRQKTARGVVPLLRSRQPRRFPAIRPNDPVIRLIWPDIIPESSAWAALTRLAQDTAYLGHSSSLTRCHFLRDEEDHDMSEAKESDLSVYPGRLQELRKAYARFEKSGSATDRPQKGAPATRRLRPAQPRSSYFGKRWLVLEHVGGEIPDLRACALVAKIIREALLAGYKRTGLGDEIPELISGHSSDGKPSRLPHIAIAPLAFVGFAHSDGHLMGFGIVPPDGSAILADENFRKVLRVLAPMDEGRGRRILTITTKRGTIPDQAFSIELSPRFEAGRQSLDPAFYVAPARTFATVTPMALDRHLKKKGSARVEEIQAQVAAACRDIGLPEPEVISAAKHSAIEGAPSAYASGKSPPWLGWRMPSLLANRQLTHAMIRFRQPVDGPVILGAGRFLGMGLCRPLDQEA